MQIRLNKAIRQTPSRWRNIHVQRKDCSTIIVCVRACLHVFLRAYVHACQGFRYGSQEAEPEQPSEGLQREKFTALRKANRGTSCSASANDPAGVAVHACLLACVNAFRCFPPKRCSFLQPSYVSERSRHRCRTSQSGLVVINTHERMHISTHTRR